MKNDFRNICQALACREPFRIWLAKARSLMDWPGAWEIRKVQEDGDAPIYRSNKEGK